MPSKLFHKQYRIPSARAMWHDYNGGAYFITICTYNKQHFFGEIVNGEMRLSEIGQYAQHCIENISQHNLYANVPMFVVMPNHVHLIVIINDTTQQHANIMHVETEHAPSLQLSQQLANDKMVNEQMQIISKRKNKLSFAIGNFKSAVTHYAHQHAIPFAWQTRFYDHIVRDRNEMNQIAEYIGYNIARWESDSLNDNR